MKRIYYTNNTLAIFWGVILSGCVLFNPQNKIPTSTSEDFISTPELTHSKTPIATSYVEATESVLPTMDLQNKNETLSNLFEKNGGCQLPCYWGIIPGESSWNVTSAYLSTFGEIYGPGGTTKVANYGVVFEGVDDPFGDMSPIFWVQNDIVKAISTNSGWVQKNFDYRLSGLLDEFGVPEEIWIRPIAQSSNDQPYFYSVIMYPSKGILVELTGNAELRNKYLSVCPQNIFSRSPYPPGLLLWNPYEKIPFKQLGINLLDDDLGWVIDEYRLLQEVSDENITNLGFYEKYKDPNTNYCINILP